MREDDLIEMYFDKHPPVSGLVKAVIEELAGNIIENNPNSTPTECLLTLEGTLTIYRKILYALLSPMVKQSGKVKFNYDNQSFLIGPLALSMLLPESESDTTNEES